MSTSAEASRRRGTLTRNSWKFVFILPAAILFTLVVIVPVGVNIFYALTDWNGYLPEFAFVGLDNFARLLRDVDVQRALINTLVFTVVNAPLQIAVGLVLALSLQRASRFSSLLRTVIVMPIALSGVVLGFIGVLVFDPRTGILSSAADSTGLAFLDQNWLGNPSFAMGTVIFMNIWQWTGYTMLIFLAGLATVPSELYEAARLDGAGRWQQFKNVTWPLLAPAATINIVLTTIGGLKIFDVIYVLTQGGPGRATESVVLRVSASNAFSQFSYSAATSFALTIVILVISLALLGVLRRREVAA